VNGPDEVPEPGDSAPEATTAPDAAHIPTEDETRAAILGAAPDAADLPEHVLRRLRRLWHRR